MKTEKQIRERLEEELKLLREHKAFSNTAAICITGTLEWVLNDD